MNTFAIIRLVFLGAVWTISIAVLGLAANSIALAVAQVWTYPTVALVAAILTHVVLTPMLIISCVTKNAYTSRVVVELAWVGILWILWLSSAVVITSTPVFPYSCKVFQTDFGESAYADCMQFASLQMCAWANTALLFVYAVVLFIVARMNNSYNRDLVMSGNAFLCDASDLVLKKTRPDLGLPRSRINLDDPRNNYGLSRDKLDAISIGSTANLAYPSETMKSTSSNPHAFWVEKAKEHSSYDFWAENPIQHNHLGLSSDRKSPSSSDVGRAISTDHVQKPHTRTSSLGSYQQSINGSGSGSRPGRSPSSATSSSRTSQVSRKYAPSPLSIQVELGPLQPVMLPSVNLRQQQAQGQRALIYNSSSRPHSMARTIEAV
ncbi:hypothetical protein CPB86DRAFT_827694 [Serendipita vermifera]|nr:hypothetical protein CPB86DRAFT_827694 [Serendipita vermifera]